LRRTYNIEQENIVIEQPPKVEMGEYALPLAFELAKKLRKAPRKIAEEIVSGIGSIEGFEKLELAGSGYINAMVNRATLADDLARDQRPRAEVPTGKVLVEHSSINPNKAAHIGHLRNAVLGDTFVRLLRYAQREIDIQNYIDNTGVQVADVIVGLSIWKRNLAPRLKNSVATLVSIITVGTSMHVFRNGTSKTSRICRPGSRPCTRSKKGRTKPQRSLI
jgi:arginyl-tRNA synthetase